MAESKGGEIGRVKKVKEHDGLSMVIDNLKTTAVKLVAYIRKTFKACANWFCGLKKGYKFLLICLLAIVLLSVAVILIAQSSLGRIDYVTENELVIPEDISAMVISDSDEIVSATDDIDEEEMAEIEREIFVSQVDENGLRYEEGVTNVLLIGTDNRNKKTKNSRSDALLILSLNENSKKIVVTSIMRDTYVAIPGRNTSEKITHAHAYGGAALTKKTVEGAFGIRIDKFVEVNFYSFIDVVDALGGVTVSHITEDELEYLNYYLGEINHLTGREWQDGMLPEAGDNIKLTGKQALSYARIRRVGDGDYQRTQRQRDVLTGMIRQAREANVFELIDAFNSVADEVKTDYSESELLKLIGNAADYKDYEIVQCRIPVEGSYKSGIYDGLWVLKIDFDANRKMLYSEVFDNETA